MSEDRSNPPEMYGELPPGWEWDPESPTATQYDGTIYPHADAPIEDATPSDATWAKITREIAANAWAIYRKRWAEAIEVGRKAETTRHALLVEAARSVDAYYGSESDEDLPPHVLAIRLALGALEGETDG